MLSAPVTRSGAAFKLDECTRTGKSRHPRMTAYLAADWLKKLSSERLTQVFGLVLVIMGARMLLLGKS